MTKVDPWSMLWNRRRTNSVPSIPLAGNSTASSLNRPAESGQIHPQIPPTRHNIEILIGEILIGALHKEPRHAYGDRSICSGFGRSVASSSTGVGCAPL